MKHQVITLFAALFSTIGIAIATIGGLIIRELCPIGLSIMAIGAVLHDYIMNK
jgi:hypothetical protein